MTNDLESKIQQCIVDALIDLIKNAAIVGTVMECQQAKRLTREKVDAVYDAHLRRFVD